MDQSKWLQKGVWRIIQLSGEHLRSVPGEQRTTGGKPGTGHYCFQVASFCLVPLSPLGIKHYKWHLECLWKKRRNELDQTWALAHVWAYIMAVGGDVYLTSPPSLHWCAVVQWLCLR